MCLSITMSRLQIIYNYTSGKLRFSMAVMDYWIIRYVISEKIFHFYIVIMEVVSF